MNLEFVKKITDLSNEVYNILGNGRSESVYESALIIELRNNRIDYKRQLRNDIFYKDELVGQNRLDILIDNSIILELKSLVKFSSKEVVQTEAYMRDLNIHYGILINFNYNSVDIKYKIDDKWEEFINGDK